MLLQTRLEQQSPGVEMQTPYWLYFTTPRPDTVLPGEARACPDRQQNHMSTLCGTPCAQSHAGKMMGRTLQSCLCQPARGQTGAKSWPHTKLLHVHYERISSLWQQLREWREQPKLPELSDLGTQHCSPSNKRANTSWSEPNTPKKQHRHCRNTDLTT